MFGIIIIYLSFVKFLEVFHWNIQNKLVNIAVYCWWNLIFWKKINDINILMWGPI